MTDRPPAKLWRVYGPRSFSTDHRSQRAAYERVRAVTKNLGTTAVVYHWQDGSWLLHERIEPAHLQEGEQP